MTMFGDHLSRLSDRTPSARRRAVRVAAAIAAFGLVATACSGSDGDGSATSDSTVGSDAFDPTNPDGTVELVPGTAPVLGDDVIIATEDGSIPPVETEPPIDPNDPDAPPPIDVTPTTGPRLPLPDPATVQRIVSLSPTHTETLFALGLGEFVVAVDPSSDYPAEAVALQDPTLEADAADLSTLLALDPDVVIVGDDPTDMAGRLGAEGVPAFSGPPAANLADVYAQIRAVAAIVGEPAAAEELVGSMEASIAEITTSLPAVDGLTYFHEIDPSYVTIAKGSFLDSLYGELGLTSIVGADPSGIVVSSADTVIQAGPDVILLADADCCAVTPDVVSNRPGWGSVPAVENGAVVELPDELVMRWGPRVVDLLQLVAGGVAAAS